MSQMSSKDAGHPNSGITFFFTIASAITTVALVIFIQGMVNLAERKMEERKVISHTSPELIDHRRAEEEAMSSYCWIDKEAGKLRIPVDLAIDRYVAGK